MIRQSSPEPRTELALRDRSPAGAAPPAEAPHAGQRLQLLEADMARLQADSARKQRLLAEAAVRILDAGGLMATLQMITHTAREVIGAHEAAVSLSSERGAPPPRPPWEREAGRDATLPARERLAAPLRSRDGAHIGRIELADKFEGEFTEEDEAILVQLGQLASSAVETMRLLDQLARTEAQYRSIVAHALEGIVQFDVHGAIHTANPSFAAMLGFADLEALRAGAGSLRELFAEAGAWDALLARLQVEQTGSRHLARLRRADGACIWALLSLRRVARPQGELIEGMVQDVSDRQESEARIRALNAELEQRVAARTRELADSESLQRTLTDAAPQIVWFAAADGSVRYLNRHWFSVTGRSAEESLDWQWLEAIHPEDVGTTQLRWSEAVALGERYQGECRIQAADGGYRHFLGVADPVRDHEGHIVHWVGIHSDVTDLKHAKEALAQSNRELEAFSYSVSHDLKAPLRAISGFGGLLLRERREQLGEGTQYLERILANAARMDQQIEDLLNLAQVSQRDLRFRAVDLSALAQQCLDDLRSHEPARCVRVSIQEELRVRGDAVLLRLVVENLIGNAWKFTAGRSEALIEFSGFALPGEQCFGVRDNGVGFDMAYAAKLFGVFQRLHHAREFPGTGVGLASVRRAIERHRGRVWAAARPGEGAAFYFTIPL